MKILALSSDYPPTRGGIARLSWQTSLALAEHHEVCVIAATSDFEAARAFDERQPFRTRRIPATLFVRELASAWAIWHEARRFKPDVVWSAIWFPEATLASYLVSPSIPHTFSAYAAEFIPSTVTWRQRVKSLLRFELERQLHRVDQIFALSSYSREHLLKLGAPESKIRVIPGGVGEEWFQVVPELAPTRPPTLLTVARLDANKGHDTVIRALPALRQAFPDLRYVIIGPATPYLETLRELARQLGVGEAVEYRGVVSDAELKQAYREADLFVMISRETEGYVEGFGLAFLEAAAAGLPSVAGRSGGIPDAVEDGVSGILVDPLSPEDVARGVRTLLEDRELLQKMGQQGRQRAWEHFRWGNVASMLTRAFQEMTGA